MSFCVDDNAMDCDTLDQWSGVELCIYSKFFFTQNSFQNFQAFLILLKNGIDNRVNTISRRVLRDARYSSRKISGRVLRGCINFYQACTSLSVAALFRY